MPSWTERPQAGAAYLNPAMVSVVLSAAADAYVRESGRPMVWPLGFVVAPLVLHRPTRDALPSSVRTHLSTWTNEHPILVAGLPARASSLAATVREGMRFGLRHQMLGVGQGGLHGLAAGPSKAEGELGHLVRAARLVGRWTAKTESPSTVFALLGVRP